MMKRSTNAGLGLCTLLWLGLFLPLSLELTGGAAAGSERFVVDIGNEPSSLDPQVQWNPDSYYVYRNIFDNLVTRDDKGEIAPEVATSWKYLSDDEIEFSLRSDIAFHDGSKLTSEDVAYSVQRITDPKFASPQLGQFNKITSAKATGPTTVVLKTDGPYPALLAQLVKLSIVPKHVVETVGKDAFNLKPVGSGPYIFDNWQRGVAVTLKRNDAYWGRKGPFATALFRPVPDPATRVADLQSGTTDLAIAFDSDLAAQLKSSPRAKVLSVLTERIVYLRFNPAKTPFDDLKIRQAVAYAIDKQGLVDGILGGYDKPVIEFLTPAHEGYVADIKPVPYDLAKAKALVAEAGAAGRTPIEFLVAPTFDQRVIQAIQQMLTEAGLKVDINMRDMVTYMQRSQAAPENSPQMNFSRWSCACQDADGVLFPVLHSSSTWSLYRNPTVDKLLDDARGTLDEKKRLDDYRQVHEIVAKDVPIVPLYQGAALYGAAKALQWQPTPNESMFLNRMSWKE
jgi:peptide/nickel transport system substrate-binding protein